MLGEGIVPTPVNIPIDVVRPAAELYAIVESSNLRASDASVNDFGWKPKGCSVPFQPTNAATPSSNASPTASSATPPWVDSHL